VPSSPKLPVSKPKTLSKKSVANTEPKQKVLPAVNAQAARAQDVKRLRSVKPVRTVGTIGTVGSVG
jgi:hypothetical protein